MDVDADVNTHPCRWVGHRLLAGEGELVQLGNCTLGKSVTILNIKKFIIYLVHWLGVFDQKDIMSTQRNRWELLIDDQSIPQSIHLDLVLLFYFVELDMKPFVTNRQNNNSNNDNNNNNTTTTQQQQHNDNNNNDNNNDNDNDNNNIGNK